MKTKSCTKIRPEGIIILRKVHGLSTFEFANIAGVTQRTVQRWEAGVHKCSYAMFSSIMDKLEKEHKELKND